MSWVVVAIVAYRATFTAIATKVGSTHPTVGGGGGSVAAPVACGFVSKPTHPYSGLAVGSLPSPLHNQHSIIMTNEMREVAGRKQGI